MSAFCRECHTRNAIVRRDEDDLRRIARIASGDSARARAARVQIPQLKATLAESRRVTERHLAECGGPATKPAGG